MIEGTAFATVLLTAVTIGLGCGVGCGSVATPFIITKLLGDRKTPGQSFAALLVFTLGKIAALVVLGLVSSLIGREVMSFLSGILPVDTGFFFRAGCIVIGVLMILSRLLERCRCGSGCGSCGGKTGRASYFISGVLYALTPCPPLTVVLVSAALVSPLQAVLIMVLFGAANSVSPLLVIAPVTGFLVRKMGREIPRLAGSLQVFSGALLVVLGLSLFGTV